MYLQEVLALVSYFTLLFAIGFFVYRKNLSENDFIIGNRSMNYWVTALAAHASDMSNWLFMGYPALLLTQGLFGAWTAIGLTAFMFLNWVFVAPKIRVATEKFGSLTFSSFFEKRLKDTSGRIRFVSAGILVIYYTVYISAALTGIGDLFEALFHIRYEVGVALGLLVTLPYVFSGGFVTLAWVDLFQGLFLMTVIVVIPLYLLPQVGGFAGICSASASQGVSNALFPTASWETVGKILSSALGWGLGYFGQPHIVTKFMGIGKVSEIKKSKWIGMSWMVLSLSAATLVGLIGIPFFQGSLANPEFVFIEMVKKSFSPFIVGFVLCAVLAAAINLVSSQILVLTSSVTEDFYKKLVRRGPSSKELLHVARYGVLAIGVISFFIAFYRSASIYTLVQYAWAGIGASFGPLVLLTLYSKRVDKVGALWGIITGGVVAGLFPFLNTDIAAMIPAFLLNLAVTYIFSKGGAHGKT